MHTVTATITIVASVSAKTMIIKINHAVEPSHSVILANKSRQATPKFNSAHHIGCQGLRGGGLSEVTTKRMDFLAKMKAENNVTGAGL